MKKATKGCRQNGGGLEGKMILAVGTSTAANAERPKKIAEKW